jgi:hypothetical protein
MRTMGRKLVVENLEGKVLLSSDLAATQPVAAEVHHTSAGPAHGTPIDTIQVQMSRIMRHCASFFLKSTVTVRR